MVVNMTRSRIPASDSALTPDALSSPPERGFAPLLAKGGRPAIVAAVLVGE